MPANNLNQKVTVIIPFFQRTAGILERSLISLMSQEGVSNLEVIIVDDSSPTPAEDECLNFSQKQKDKIRIVKQSNKGPAAARNTGLDSVSDDTQYIAFLDSDDEWSSDHLKNAITALEAGYDFYFSDLYQLGQTISAFNRAKRIIVDDHPLLFVDNPFLHQYNGNMQEQILKGNIIGTPTVVYRYSHSPNLRFREDFVRAGEDYMFWLSLVSMRPIKIAFSSKPEATCGAGVNVYSGTKFGSLEYMELAYFEAKFKKTVLSEFSLSEEVREGIVQHLESYNIRFMRGLVHRLRRGQHINLNLLIKYCTLMPGFIFSVPRILFKIIRER